MISLLIKSYFALFMAVGVACLFIFIFGSILILRLFNKPIEPPADFIEKIFEEATSPAATPSPAIEELAEPVDALGVPERDESVTPPDLSSIAGADVMSTQLDLARAYIEAGKGVIAKSILKVVVEQGSDAQQVEARNLLGLI